VKAGTLKVGTPLCVPDKENLRIGVVESLELNKKPVQSATPKDGSVALRISGASNVTFGRHFEGSN
jgi:translation initiation factor IF-2